MTKFITSLLVAAIAAFQGRAPSDGNTGDVWLGVIVDDVQWDFRGQPGPKLNAGLEPVAALVGGKWTFDVGDDNLPTRWEARLFDGRRMSMRTSGPLEAFGTFEHLAVSTDLGFPLVEHSGDDDHFDRKGIAFTGSIDVQLFNRMSEDGKSELLRFLTPDMRKAELIAIDAKAKEDARYPNGVTPERAKLLRSRVSLPLEIEIARSATFLGESFYVIEGGKAYGPDYVGCGIRSGASAKRDRSGRLHRIATWSSLDCNELHVGHIPMVLVARNGVSCWLNVLVYEDGVEYRITRPGEMDADAPACDIK